MIDTILFDLDDTLYPPETGIMDQIRALMLVYIQERLGLSLKEAEGLRRRYFRTFGTTMRGLQINHHIDPDEFLDYVHNIPLEAFLRPNARLGAVLESLPHEKVVFTNASREHAERVLGLLSIRRHFSRIVDVRDVGYESKPQPASYRRLCDLLGATATACLLVEDNIRNLLPAKDLGMTTVLVRPGGGGPHDGVDHVIGDVAAVNRLPVLRSQLSQG